MTDIDGGREVRVDTEVPEGLRVALGQLETLRLVERQERRAAGEPALELMPDEPDEAA